MLTILLNHDRDKDLKFQCWSKLKLWKKEREESELLVIDYKDKNLKKSLVQKISTTILFDLGFKKLIDQWELLLEKLLKVRMLSLFKFQTQVLTFMKENWRFLHFNKSILYLCSLVNQ